LPVQLKADTQALEAISFALPDVFFKFLANDLKRLRINTKRGEFYTTEAGYGADLLAGPPEVQVSVLWWFCLRISMLMGCLAHDKTPFIAIMQACVTSDWRLTVRATTSL
jgi:hypothetical protein